MQGANLMQKIKLFTLNVWSGFRYNGLIKLEEYESPETREKRFGGLVNTLKKENPDIVFLNEANPLFEYADKMKEATGMIPLGHMGVAGVRMGKLGFPLNLREGDLILVKPEFAPELLGQKHLGGKGYCGNFFSFHFDNLTQAVLTKNKLSDGRDLYTCVTHWIAAPAVSEENRDKIKDLAKEWNFPEADIQPAIDRLNNINNIKVTEAKRLVKWLHEVVPAGAPLIVAGDFNSEAHWNELKILTEDGFTCLKPEENGFYTWDPEKNTNLKKFYYPETTIKQKSLYHQLDAADEMFRRNIDHFFIKNIDKASVTDCRVCATEPIDGISVSDHFGVTATIEV